MIDGLFGWLRDIFGVKFQNALRERLLATDRGWTWGAHSSFVKINPISIFCGIEMNSSGLFGRFPLDFVSWTHLTCFVGFHLLRWPSPRIHFGIVFFWTQSTTAASCWAWYTTTREIFKHFVAPVAMLRFGEMTCAHLGSDGVLSSWQCTECGGEEVSIARDGRLVVRCQNLEVGDDCWIRNESRWLYGDRYMYVLA